MSYASRVKAGAEFLDSMEPGWYSRINVDDFSITNTESCILGQVFNGFHDGERRVAVYEGVETNEDFNYVPSRKWLDDHGFDLTINEYLDENMDNHVKWIELRWTQEIDKRKS